MNMAQTQPILMFLIVALCWASAFDWFFVKHSFPATVAFFAFGLGYGALGFLFRGAS